MLQAVCQTSLTIHSSTLAWVEKISFIRVKCLVQEQNTMTRQGWNPDFSTPSPLCQPQGHQISQLHWNAKKFKLPFTQLTWLLEYKKLVLLIKCRLKDFQLSHPTYKGVPSLYPSIHRVIILRQVMPVPTVTAKRWSNARYWIQWSQLTTTL